MMCQRIGDPPISTIGFGVTSVSSARRVPSPPARITVFIVCEEAAFSAADEQDPGADQHDACNSPGRKPFAENEHRTEHHGGVAGTGEYRERPHDLESAEGRQP